MTGWPQEVGCWQGATLCKQRIASQSHSPHGQKDKREQRQESLFKDTLPIMVTFDGQLGIPVRTRLDWAD